MPASLLRSHPRYGQVQTSTNRRVLPEVAGWMAPNASRRGFENGNDTLLRRNLHRKQVAPNRGYNQKLDLDEMTIAAVVGDDILENSFAGAVQKCPPAVKILRGVRGTYSRADND